MVHINSFTAVTTNTNRIIQVWNLEFSYSYPSLVQQAFPAWKKNEWNDVGLAMLYT